MTKQELDQLYYLQKEIVLLEEKLKQFQQKQKNNQKNNFPFVHDEAKNLQEKIAAIMDVLRERQNMCMKKVLELESYIAKMEDSYLRIIFSLRHAQGLSWVQIAHRMGNNTADSVRMAHDRYLKKIS